MVNTRNYKLKFTIYNCLLMLSGIEMSNSQQSPCPRFFQYKRDFSNYMYGVITVPTPTYYNLIKLNVQLSIGNDISSKDIREIVFMGTAEDILHKRPLVFTLQFPPWNNSLPQITYISINDQPLCVGEPMKPTSGASSITTVNMLSTVRLSTFGGSDDNKSTTKENKDYRQFINPNQNNINNYNSNFQNNMETTQRPNINFYTIYNKIYNYNAQPTRKPIIPLHSNSQFPNSIYTTTRRNSVKPINPNNNFDSCGRPKVSSNLLIAHGSDVMNGAHPWIGALFLRKTSSNQKFLCGASLITKKIALTAGHCVAPYSHCSLYLTFGRIGINDWLDENSQLVKVQKVEFHPDYKEDTADADIAILRFTKELMFTSTVQPVCLWKLDNPLQNIVNQTGVVVGWGKNENFQDAQKLQEIYLPVVSEEMCLRAADGFYSITSNRTFCAGGNNKGGPCNGDSGSGFYFYIDGRWTIRGIVSRSLLDSSGRCDLSQYSVYLDVAKYIQWIYKFL